MVYGNILAFALILIQQQWHLIRLNPTVYYVEAVPVTIDWTYFAIINVSTLIICVLALVIPSYLISNIHPARSIRFE